jgi:hypothetical protein
MSTGSDTAGSASMASEPSPNEYKALWRQFLDEQACRTLEDLDAELRAIADAEPPAPPVQIPRKQRSRRGRSLPMADPNDGCGCLVHLDNMMPVITTNDVSTIVAAMLSPDRAGRDRGGLHSVKSIDGVMQFTLRAIDLV